MIDENGHLHCNKCGKEIAMKLEGLLEWYCSRCHHFNRDFIKALDKSKDVVVTLK